MSPHAPWMYTMGVILILLIFQKQYKDVQASLSQRNKDFCGDLNDLESPDYGTYILFNSIYTSLYIHVTLYTRHSIYTSLYIHVTLYTRHSIYTSFYIHVTLYTHHSVYTSLYIHVTMCTRHSV